jgi:hypothetical protein
MTDPPTLLSEALLNEKIIEKGKKSQKRQKLVKRAQNRAKLLV